VDKRGNAHIGLRFALHIKATKKIMQSVGQNAASMCTCTGHFHKCVVMLTLATPAKIQGSRDLFGTNHDVDGVVGRRTRFWADCVANCIGE